MYNLTSVNQSQWQALIDAIRQGGGGGGGSASAVSYDNTISQLTATTVQGAIDEVSSDLDTAIDDINTNTQAINELNSNKENKLTTEEVTVTTGTSQYSGYYYANINIAEYTAKYNKLIGFFVRNTSGNHFATAMMISANELRVYSSQSSVTVTLRLTFAN